MQGFFYKAEYMQKPDWSRYDLINQHNPCLFQYLCRIAESENPCHIVIVDFHLFPSVIVATCNKWTTERFF